MQANERVNGQRRPTSWFYWIQIKAIKQANGQHDQIMNYIHYINSSAPRRGFQNYRLSINFVLECIYSESLPLDTLDDGSVVSLINVPSRQKTFFVEVEIMTFSDV